MNRILSSLFAAGLIAAPTAALAGGTYVRADGVVFDSDVGAACGALMTDVLFQPGERSVDLYDESTLDHLATCFRSGELANARIAIIGFGDGDLAAASGSDLAQDRVASVVSYLTARGVDARQLTTWAYATGWPGDASYAADRVQFRIIPDAATASTRTF
jgi:outer membrane protein OmpA-like peptidoglycan-associated protein